MKTGKLVGAQLREALTINLQNPDISLLIFFTIFPLSVPAIFLFTRIAWGKEGIGGNERRCCRDRRVCVCGERSSNKSVPSLPLESPESLLHLCPTCRISRGFVYWGYAGGGGGNRRSGAIQCFSLVGYHVLYESSL